jgi:hypothetical protein
MFHDLTGFLFTGAGTLPGFLAFSVDPAIGVMAFVFLLMVAGLSALRDPEAPFRAIAERHTPPPRD